MTKKAVKILSLLAMLSIAAAPIGSAEKINTANICSAYENIFDMSLTEFSDACVNYFGLDKVEPAENTFSDLSGGENLLKLNALGIILGNGYGTVSPNAKVGEQRGLVILKRISDKLSDSDLENAKSLHAAPNVTPEMMTASYWINRIPNAHKVLMNQDEIKELNEDIKNHDGTYIANLENYAEIFDGAAMQKELSSFKNPTGLYINGKEIQSSYWGKLKRTIKNAKCTKNQKMKYGIVTEKTILRQYPTLDMLSDDPNDPEWDDQAITSVNVNEPVTAYIQTSDKKFTYVRARLSEGWIETEKIAICSSKEEWENAFNPENFVIVTGDRIFLEPSTDTPEISYKQLTMGTKLKLVTDYDGTHTIIDRTPQSNYIVTLPMRDAKGNYYEKDVMIPANRDVNVGYLPFTRANIVKLAFNCQGDRYGWGGMLESSDCSQFACEIYKCFGITLPRNTTWQGSVPYGVTVISELDTEEKALVLDTAEPGSIIQFPGHEMIYLGKVNDEYYTINNVSSLVENGIKKRIRSTVVNTLSTTRANGKTWFSELSKIIDITKK